MTTLNVYLKGESCQYMWLDWLVNRISWTTIKHLNLWEDQLHSRLHEEKQLREQVGHCLKFYSKCQAVVEGTDCKAHANFEGKLSMERDGRGAHHATMEDWGDGDERIIWRHCEVAKKQICRKKGEIAKTGTCHWRVDASGFLLTICCVPWVYLGRCWSMVICPYDWGIKTIAHNSEITFATRCLKKRLFWGCPFPFPWWNEGAWGPIWKNWNPGLLTLEGVICFEYF